MLFDRIQDGFLRRCSRIGGGSKKPLHPKNCHIYATMIKLGVDIPYLKKIHKTYKSCDTPFEFC